MLERNMILMVSHRAWGTPFLQSLVTGNTHSVTVTVACTECCWVPVLLLQIEELYKRLDDAVTVISTQNCDLKTQVADVQVRAHRTAEQGPEGLNCSCIGLSGYLDLLLKPRFLALVQPCCCRGRQTTCAT